MGKTQAKSVRKMYEVLAKAMLLCGYAAKGVSLCP